VLSARLWNGRKRFVCHEEGRRGYGREGGGGYRFNNDPWKTPIVFLYNDEDARYAVEADISHQPVGSKTAFFDLTIQRVARQ
jgi:hypothetical protein